MRKLFAFLLLFALSFGALAQSTPTYTMCSAATTVAACSAVNAKTFPPLRTFQAYGTTSAGAGAATILVQGSNDNSNWVTLGTITLTLATTVSNDGFVAFSPWPWIRGNVSAISGTGASVNLTVGMEQQ